ncbi:hypothetical protein XELAEV_18001107mg [Xenopus laevis]|uniref:Uncharacterized protein n=1 Tax=Xenopus laevis TaxID=8355 RepID=A0A974GYR9_XENLA|nr:hypothetical protein XELAEV_18001107mg [Xenopus laevis]
MHKAADSLKAVSQSVFKGEVKQQDNSKQFPNIHSLLIVRGFRLTAINSPTHIMGTINTCRGSFHGTGVNVEFYSHCDNQHLAPQ